MGYDTAHPTTSISPTHFLVGLTVILPSCPSAVRNSIGRPTEKLRAQLRIGAASYSVMPGLDPGIPLRKARPCHINRDGRDKPGHDGLPRPHAVERSEGARLEACGRLILRDGPAGLLRMRRIGLEMKNQ